MSIKRQTSKDSLASLGSENIGNESINESPDSNSSFSFTTNSSFDKEEFLNNCINQLTRNRHGVKTETFLQSFGSPQPNGPFCSSRNNSASKIKRLELPAPDISPIAQSSVLFNGTFVRGTLRHSIDRTDSTLRRRSHSVSGHEKWFDETVLPLGQRSEPSSLNTSPRHELNLACLAPRNTPDVSSSISSPEESWRRHSLGELERANANDAQTNRSRTRAKSRNVRRTDDYIPVVHHSNREVDEWLNQNPSRSNIRNLNVSDFDVAASSSHAPSIAHFDAYNTGAFYPNEYMQYVGYPPPLPYPCHMGGHWDRPPMCHMCQPPLQHFHPMAPYYYPVPHPAHLGHFHPNPSMHGGYNNNNIHDHRQHDDQSDASKPPSTSQKTSRKSNKTAAHGHQRRVRVSKKNIQAMRSLKKKICNRSSSSIKVKTLANM